MTDMPRPRPPYLNRVVTRHGRVVWVVRVGTGDQRRRVRLRSEFGTPEFMAEYKAALIGQEITKESANAGTLSWLLERYRETTAWTRLSLATRRQRENIFKQVLKTAGNEPLTRITRTSIIAGRDRRSTTPFQARHFLKAMRGFFGWAFEAGHVTSDPTHGVTYVDLPKSNGFPIWMEEHVERYSHHWPIGTRQRVWLDVLLYTGLRRGDAVRLGRQHVKDGVATILTEKSGFTIEVSIPILPVLEATLRTGPCGDLAFIAGESGRPLSKESFGNEFRKACRAAGVPGSGHGLRKVAATRAANNGATVAELEAIFGWTGGGMASLYTRAADRRRLARRAMHKLLGD
jgi:integrase